MTTFTIKAKAVLVSVEVSACDSAKLKATTLIRLGDIFCGCSVSEENHLCT